MTRSATAPDPATAVFTRRVAPGHKADYARLIHDATTASARLRSHLAATVLHKDGTARVRHPVPSR
jgi:antibiotic biosynthesis monooxygenase (ABM) superfamily enzyme